MYDTNVIGNTSAGRSEIAADSHRSQKRTETTFNKIQCGYETTQSNESMKYNELEMTLICIEDGGALRKCEMYALYLLIRFD